MSVCAAYFALEFDDVLVSEISVVHFVSHVKVYLEDERKVGFPFRVTFCDFSGRGLLYLRVFEKEWWRPRFLFERASQSACCIVEVYQYYCNSHI